MSICKKCFHSYVCEQFNEDRECDNKKCHFYNDHFVSTDDVVKVVRCKDCKHFIPDEMLDHKEYPNEIEADGVCDNIDKYTDIDHFCYYGKLKECEGK